MTAPKRRIAGQTTEITRCTTHRQHLLRPDDELRNTAGYMYGKACEDHGQIPHVASMISTHCHLFQTDTTGRRDRFMQQFFSNVSRKHNIALNRRENLWRVGEPGDNVALTLDDVIARTLYTILQPVAAGLVKHASEWTGFQILPRDWGKELVFTRPPDCGPNMPEKVVIRPQPPPGFEDFPLDQVIAFFEDLVARAERDIAKRRRGRPVVGIKACEAISPFAVPKTSQPMRTLNPRFSCKDRVRARRAIQAMKRFKADYKQARKAFCDGNRKQVFPSGTLQMVDRASVEVAPTQPDDPHRTDVTWTAAVQAQWDEWMASA